MTLADAIGWLQAQWVVRAAETIPLRQAAGRVLAGSVGLAPSPLHASAAIDGVAVRAADTAGASDYAPLRVAGTPVRAGDTMPADADAVLPPHGYEDGAAVVAIGRGGGVHPPGHDVAAGAVLAKATVLTALHLALLPGDPLVRRLARVAAPDLASLHALVAAAGAIVVGEDPDLVLLAERPESGWVVQADGIAIRPGEATAIGLLGATPAIVLPRHPAEAATVFAVLAVPVLRRVAGLPELVPVIARLTRKISSALGQVDAVRVRVDGGVATLLGPAEGIGLLAAAGANGLVLVPEGSEGYPAGAMVPIYLL